MLYGCMCMLGVTVWGGPEICKNAWNHDVFLLTWGMVQLHELARSSWDKVPREGSGWGEGLGGQASESADGGSVGWRDTWLWVCPEFHGQLLTCHENGPHALHVLWIHPQISPKPCYHVINTYYHARCHIISWHVAEERALKVWQARRIGNVLLQWDGVPANLGTSYPLSRWIATCGPTRSSRTFQRFNGDSELKSWPCLAMHSFTFKAGSCIADLTLVQGQWWCLPLDETRNGQHCGWVLPLWHWIIVWFGKVWHLSSNQICQWHVFSWLLHPISLTASRTCGWGGGTGPVHHRTHTGEQMSGAGQHGGQCHQRDGWGAWRDSHSEPVDQRSTAHARVVSWPFWPINDLITNDFVLFLAS